MGGSRDGRLLDHIVLRVRHIFSQKPSLCSNLNDADPFRLIKSALWAGWEAARGALAWLMLDQARMNGPESVPLNLRAVRAAQLAYLDAVHASWSDPGLRAPIVPSEPSEADIDRTAASRGDDGFRRSRREWPYH